MSMDSKMGAYAAWTNSEPDSEIEQLVKEKIGQAKVVELKSIDAYAWIFPHMPDADFYNLTRRMRDFLQKKTGITHLLFRGELDISSLSELDEDVKTNLRKALRG